MSDNNQLWNSGDIHKHNLRMEDLLRHSYTLPCIVELISRGMHNKKHDFYKWSSSLFPNEVLIYKSI